MLEPRASRRHSGRFAEVIYRIEAIVATLARIDAAATRPGRRREAVRYSSASSQRFAVKPSWRLDDSRASSGSPVVEMWSNKDRVLARILKRIERSVNSRQAYKFFMRDWIALNDLQRCADAVSTMRFTRTLEPLEMSAPRAGRIAVIAPHPDDEMLGAGGTLIHALRAGADVRCIYVTSSNPPAQVEAETTRVASRIGYRTQFLRLPVHAIPFTDDSVAALGRALAAEPVDVLFVPDLPRRSRGSPSNEPTLMASEMPGLDCGLHGGVGLSGLLAGDPERRRGHQRRC